MKYKKQHLFLALVFYTLLLVPYRSAAQNGPTPEQYIINGTVKDSYGPLPGVHVLIKGTNTGTFTDKDGEFSLTVTASYTLVFSYMGYKTLELSILGRNTLEVELQAEATQLQEVEVNAGYYTVKERERTGSISRVTAEEIELQPVVSPLEAIQGRMPGVIINRNSNIPGSATSIQIRGQNSLRSEGNYPLYIIDGIPINAIPISVTGGLMGIGQGIDPLNTLNLSSIASIEVLKDADATAIYGSRGANGVVLISTKMGTEGKARFNLNIYNGIGSISNKLNLLNTQQYLEMRTEAFSNAGTSPTLSNAPDLLVWDQNSNTDWQQLLLGNPSFINDVQATFSGGNANTRFLIGSAYHKEDMVFPGDFGYKRLNGNFNVRHTSPNQKLKISLSTNYGVDHTKSFNEGLFVENAFLLPPNAPELYNADGSLNWENSTWSNPLGSLRKTQDVTTNNILANAILSYEPIPGLIAKANLGFTHLFSEEKTKDPNSSTDPAFESTNYSQLLSTKRKSWILEPQITYSKGIGGGNLEILLGCTFQNSNSDNIYIMGQGYSDDSLLENLSASENSRVVFQNDLEYAYVAAFGRMGFHWEKKYYLNLTGRRDGSSRFGPNKRFSNFGAIGGSWIFSKEGVFENSLRSISFGKLRGSYGTTGSDQIADYGYYDTYSPTDGPNGLYPTQLANPNYSWEVTRKLEWAIDLGLFEDRLMISTSWYKNRSSNQLVGYSLPATTGFSSIQANLPAIVENKGWEIQLISKQLRSKKMDWNTSVNLTIPKNKLLAFPGIENSSYANTYKVGEPLGITLLYESLGINSETGLFEVKDINGDERYNFTDRTVIRNLRPKYYGGVNNSFRYKNLSLDFFAEFVKQDGRNLLSQFYTPGRTLSNQSITIMDRWKESGDKAYIQQFSTASAANTAFNRTAISDLAIGEASYLRLKSLSLSYRLSDIYTKKIGINSARIYVHAQNLFTITPYKGLDAQSARLGSLTFLPPLRTFTLGLQLSL